MFFMTQRYVKRGRSENSKAQMITLANKRRRWQRQDAVSDRNDGIEERQEEAAAPRLNQLSPVDSGLGIEVLTCSPRLRYLGSTFGRSLDWSSITEEGGEARLVHTFSARTKFDGDPCVLCGVSLTTFGDIVVSDVANKKVKVFDAAGRLKVECCVPQYYSGGLVEPLGVVALNTGEIATCDGINGNIKVFTPEGRLLTMFGKVLSRPTAIASNSHGHIIVTDQYKEDVFIFRSLTDKRTTRISKENEGNLTIGIPTALCLTIANDIVIYEKSSNRLIVCDEEGKCRSDFDLNFLGAKDRHQEENGANASASNIPDISSLCTENHNTILVSDKEGNRITSVNIDTREISREVISRAGALCQPTSLATNDSGLLVVLEENKETVKIFKYGK